MGDKEEDESEEGDEGVGVVDIGLGDSRTGLKEVVIFVGAIGPMTGNGLGE